MKLCVIWAVFTRIFGLCFEKNAKIRSQNAQILTKMCQNCAQYIKYRVKTSVTSTKLT